MVQVPGHRPVRRTPALTGYFYRSLTEAARARRLKPRDATVLYIAELLTDYGDSRRLFDYDGERIHLPALADLYRQAAETESRRERNTFMRRLGDVALFVAGLFPGYLERRPVGVDYYIAMGRGAYAFLDHEGAGLPERAALSPFSELASRFDGFVQILSDLGGGEARQTGPLPARGPMTRRLVPAVEPASPVVPPALRH